MRSDERDYQQEVKQMKTETKAIIASVVVIALALTAVSGVTYSWYSDTDSIEITVTTSKVDIRSSLSKAESSTAKITETDPNFQVEISPNQNATFDVSIDDQSTTDIQYRMYIVVDTDGLTAYDMAHIHIHTPTGTYIPLTASSMSDEDVLREDLISGKKVLILRTWTSAPASIPVDSFSFSTDGMYGGTASAPVYAFSNDDPGTTYTQAEYLALSDGMKGATTLWSSGDASFSFKVVVQAVQASYTPSSSYTNLSETGTATITSGNRAFNGSPYTDGGRITDVKVVFNEIASTALEGKTLTVMTTDDDDGFLISDGTTLKLELDEATIPSGGSVDIMVTIPDRIESPTVICTSGGEQPLVLGYYHDEGKTVVEFTTTHFSNFVIAPVESTRNVEVSTIDMLQRAIEVGFSQIILGSDLDLTVDGSPKMISFCSGKTTTLDLGGHGIISNAMYLMEFDCVDSSIVTIKNGTLKVSGNGANGNVIDIFNTNDLTVVLDGVKVQSANVGLFKGVGVFKTTNTNIIIQNGCSIDTNYYAISVGQYNTKTTLKCSDSTFSGCCAYQTWSNYTKASFTNCVLQGINDSSLISNDFATIVYNESLLATELNLSNCTIKSVVVPDDGGNANRQYYMSIRSPGAAINIDDCTFSYSDGSTEEIYSDLLNTDGALFAVVSNLSKYLEAVGTVAIIDGKPITI